MCIHTNTLTHALLCTLWLEGDASPTSPLVSSSDVTASFIIHVVFFVDASGGDGSNCEGM